MAAAEVFISYRGSDGNQPAQSLKKGLENRGVRTSMEEAAEKQDHSKEIASCNSFVMMLTNGYLDSLLAPKSTAYKDLAAAVANGLTIVPVYDPSSTQLPSLKTLANMERNVLKALETAMAHPLRAGRDETFYTQLLAKCREQDLSTQPSEMDRPSSGSEASVEAQLQQLSAQLGDQEHQDADDYKPSLAASIALNAPSTPPPVHVRKIVLIEPKHVLKAHADGVSTVAFSPDSTQLASGSGDKTIRLWDPASGNQRTILTGHNGRVHGLAYIGSGTILFSASKDKTVMEWDLLRNLHRKTMEGHTNVVWSVACSKDGRQVVSVSHDLTLRWWDTMSGELLRTVSKVHTATIYHTAVSPCGKLLATASGDKTVKIWDMATGAVVKTLTGHSSHVSCVAWSPTGKQLASSSWDETVKLWDLEEGKAAHTFTGHNGKVNCVVFAPDGETLLSGGEDKQVCVWKVRSRDCLQHLTGHTEEILSLAITADQTLLASGSADNTIRTWKIQAV